MESLWYHRHTKCVSQGLTLSTASLVLLSEDQDVVSYWEKLPEDNEVNFNDKNRITTTEEVFNATDMSSENITEFTKEILSYCKDNLAKVEAFIPSPFVSKYLLDEVIRKISYKCHMRFLTLQEISTESFISNIGGLMGLCMGLSFVSLAEVGIFITNFIWRKTCLLMSK